MVLSLNPLGFQRLQTVVWLWGACSRPLAQGSIVSLPDWGINVSKHWQPAQSCWSGSAGKTTPPTNPVSQDESQLNGELSSRGTWDSQGIDILGVINMIQIFMFFEHLAECCDLPVASRCFKIYWEHLKHGYALVMTNKTETCDALFQSNHFAMSIICTVKWRHTQKKNNPHN